MRVCVKKENETEYNEDKNKSDTVLQGGNEEIKDSSEKKLKTYEETKDVTQEKGKDGRA